MSNEYTIPGKPQLDLFAMTNNVGTFTHWLETDVLDCDLNYRRMRELPESGTLTLRDATKNVKVLAPWATHTSDYISTLEAQRSAKQITQFDCVYVSPLSKKSTYQRIIASPIVENDKLIAMTGLIFDITNEHLAMQELIDYKARIEHLSESGQIVFLEVDLKTDIVTSNSIWRKKWNFTEHEHVKWGEFLTRISSKFRHFFENKFQEVMITKKEREGILQESDDETSAWRKGAWRKFKFTPVIENNRVVKIRMTNTDITDEFTAQQALKEQLIVERDLREKNEEAQAQLEELNAHLEETVAELELKREHEKRMLAVIGHELRTPAAILEMQLHDMQDLGDGKLPKTKQSITHLLTVLDDLRAIARPATITDSTTPIISICDTMDNIIDYVRPLADGTDINFKYSLLARHDSHARMSPDALRQVVANLVKNAIKHSECTKIEVTLAVHSDKQQVYSTITVSDNGVGIPASEVPTIFDPFVRGKETKSDGTGLGLSIIKDIAKQYNGDVTYKDNVPYGSTFEVTFVNSKHEPLNVKPPSTAVASENYLDKKTILFAEDNATVQMLSKKMLENRGATVIAVNNGKEALALLNQNVYFDFILTDIMMPEIDGYELTTIARTLGYNKPIIGVTAATIGDETSRLLDAGANFCIEKPINLYKLNNLLETVYKKG